MELFHLDQSNIAPYLSDDFEWPSCWRTDVVSLLEETGYNNQYKGFFISWQVKD